MPLENAPTCGLIDRFTWKQKALMRTGWFGFMCVGAWGIFLQDPLWAVLYVSFGAAGFALVVLPCLCTHCPYPARFSTCLFLPAGLLRRFYPYRGPQMSPSGKVAVAVVMAGIVVLPQFWLISSKGLLLLFWLLAVPVIAAFPLHYCHRCRHMGCPMNRASADS